MCLRTVDKKPKKKSGFGYKLVHHIDDKRVVLGRLAGQGRTVALNKWVTDENERPIATLREEYPAGFHIFSSIKDVRYFQNRGGWHGSNMSIYKVRYTDAVATGTQRGLIGQFMPIDLPVVVARRMKVMRRVDNVY